MLKLLAGGGHAVTFIARDGQGGERYAAELQDNWASKFMRATPPACKPAAIPSNSRPGPSI